MKFISVFLASKSQAVQTLNRLIHNYTFYGNQLSLFQPQTFLCLQEFYLQQS